MASKPPSSAATSTVSSSPARRRRDQAATSIEVSTVDVLSGQFPLTAVGHTEDQIFEVTVAAAVAARCFDAGQRALDHNATG
jgi:hypothetical protein